MSHTSDPKPKLKQAVTKIYPCSPLLPSPAFLPLSQGEGQHIPELAAEGQEPLLTSIYAKIQPHSPEATGTDSNVMGSGTIVLGHL